MHEVTICVATYGHDRWRDLAERRALRSARKQPADIVGVHFPDCSLAEVRNRALTLVGTEWVVFLDADDELAPGYVEALLAAAGDVRAPAVQYVNGMGVGQVPYVPRVAGHSHACKAECLPLGNWLVIGSLVRAEMVRQVGGFRDWPCIEDWDLWVRCWQAGATPTAVPEAVYRAHVRRDSRNRAARNGLMLETHRAIARDLGLPVP